MNAGVQSVKAARARTVRLAKAWNKQYSEPALCSFNIVALALGSVTQAGSLDETLYTFFDDTVRSLRSECTPDPAGVSRRSSCRSARTSPSAALTEARDALAAARATDNDDDRLDALHKILGHTCRRPTAHAPSIHSHSCSRRAHRRSPPSAPA